MRGYDFKHPKGRTYTTAELKARREQWRARYAKTGGSSASADHLDLDRQTFLAFRRKLSFEKTVQPMAGRYSGAPIMDYWYNGLVAFLEEVPDVADEFLDADLEALRLALIDAVHAYTDHVGQWTFPRDRGEGNALPSEMKYGDSNEYQRRVSELDRESNAINDRYGELVRQGRRKLGVDVSRAHA